MTTKFLKPIVALTAAAAMWGPAIAGTITLNPQASNGGAGAVDPSQAQFTTTGGTLILGSASQPSVLTINGNSGIQGFTETGTIYLREFTDGASNSIVWGNLGQNLYATYTMAGAGQWAGTAYSASTTGLSFNMSLYSNFPGGGSNLLLGTASLVGDPTDYAIALLGGSSAPGSSGVANTVMAAVLAFTPSAGFSGSDGFFNDPLNFHINVGSVGGNVGNTTYSVSQTGVVTVRTPSGTGANSPSTGNFTFTTQQVPEPGMMALVGLALGAAGFVSRRKRAEVV